MVSVLLPASLAMIGLGLRPIPEVVTLILPLYISKSSGTVILTVAPAISGLLFYTISVTLLISLMVAGFAETCTVLPEPLTGLVALIKI